MFFVHYICLTMVDFNFLGTHSRGIHEYGECQISAGAVAAIFAVVCDLMALMFVGLMARNQIRSHGHIVSA